MSKKIPVGLSNKHVHLSQEHLDILFGKGHKLTPIKDLGQPGQYACDEKVDLVGPKRTIKGVRVLGPIRKESQVELSFSDGIFLGLGSIPVKDSGSLEGTPGVKIVGPNGEVELERGVIAAKRHVHMNTKEAAEYGVKDKDIVSIPVDGERGLVFNNVLVRVSDSYALEYHVDIEEGNAAGLKNGQFVDILK